MNKTARSRKGPAPAADNDVVLARTLRALAHPARLRLLRRLLEGDCCVSEAGARLKISQPNVSQHLKILKTAGLIAGRRRGASICYRLTDPRVERVLRDLAPKENVDEERHGNE